MFGSLLKESGVVPQLTKSASNELANLSTMFLALTIGSLMQAETFIQTQTLLILLLGLGAFVLDTVAGILFGKVLTVATGGKINPLVGAAGISAFPMSGRLVQKVAQEEDFTNYVLMHAMGANTAGQLGSVIAGGVLLTLVTNILGLEQLAKDDDRPGHRRHRQHRRPGVPAVDKPTPSIVMCTARSVSLEA